MNCKICNKEVKGKIGLNRHVSGIHKSLTLLDYHIQYEGLVLPICNCGKICKKIQREIDFASTCGNKDCVKSLLRQKRLDFMKNNPEQTAWRLSNLSYPEKLFKEKCEFLNLDKKYLIVREYSVFPYFIDFAFLNEKIAIEIDGSQHQLEERKESDKKKEEILINNGWRIIRFTENEIKNKIDVCFEELFKFINSDVVYEKVGIFEYKEILTKEEKSKKYFATQKNICKCGNIKQKKSTLCNVCSKKKTDKVQAEDRPSYEVLIEEIKNLGFVGVGKKYKVSDNAVRGWKRRYEKTMNQDDIINSSNLKYISTRKVDRPSYKELNEYIKNNSISAAARIYKVSQSTIKNWMKFYEKYGE